MSRGRDRPLAPGALPGFRDMTPIGRGTLATVYRAVAIGSAMPVAIKLFDAGAIPDRSRHSFVLGVEALVEVTQCPHLVTLYGSGISPDGCPFILSELCVEGMPSGSGDGPRTVREVTGMAIKIAGALDSAHQRGHVHGDIKPQDILVCRSGSPALGDVGLATLRTSVQAASGELGPIALHTAPEILEGSDVSPAADVYGLASVLYLLLGGRAAFAPYENESLASLILRAIRDPVPPLQGASIPIALSDLLGAALAKDPLGRPSTAAEFASALAAIESALDEPTQAPSRHSGEPPPRPAGGPPLPPLSKSRPAMRRVGPSVAQPDPADRSVVVPDSQRGTPKPR